jgi:hypothetical protein
LLNKLGFLCIFLKILTAIMNFLKTITYGGMNVTTSTISSSLSLNLVCSLHYICIERREQAARRRRGDNPMRESKKRERAKSADKAAERTWGAVCVRDAARCSTVGQKLQPSGCKRYFFPVNCLCRRLFAAVAANTGAMRLLFVLLQFPPGV